MTSLQGNFISMIQRIQSIFLLISIVCSLAAFSIPAFNLHPTAGNTGDIYKITALKTLIISAENKKDLVINWSLVVINSLAIIMMCICLFRYNSRKLQVKICNWLILVMAGLILMYFFQWKQISVLAGAFYITKFESGTALIVISLIMICLARYFIQKDEALVRSADRLR